MKWFILKASVLGIALGVCAAQAGTNSSSLVMTASGSGAGGVQLGWNQLPDTLGYRIEFSHDLAQTNWTSGLSVAAWMFDQGQWLDRQPQGNRFYRLQALPQDPGYRGQILSAVVVKTFNTNEMKALYTQYNMPVIVEPQYNVDVVQVVYQTVDVHGEKTVASGALMVPVGYPHPMALGSYQHGTTLKKDEVASNLNSEEMLIGVALGSIGYVMSLPDYLGMGSSPGRHPYVHAKSEATASVDMLRAAKFYCSQQIKNLNGQLFLMGYSQGGQATMALHKELEQHHTNEFQITASSPMAGPYDMSGTMFNIMSNNQAYNTPYYFVFTLFSYNEAYQLYDSPSLFLAQPYATNLWPLLDGSHSDSEVNSALPSIPGQILLPGMLESFKTNSNHPFRLVLMDNDLYRWVPKTKMRMFHCHGDKTVPYNNSQVAYDHFRASGATQVELVDPFPLADHSTGAYFCLVAAKDWFESIRIK